MHNLKHGFCELATRDGYGSWCPKIQLSWNISSQNAKAHCSVEVAGAKRLSDARTWLPGSVTEFQSTPGLRLWVAGPSLGICNFMNLPAKLSGHMLPKPDIPQQEGAHTALGLRLQLCCSWTHPESHPQLFARKISSFHGFLHLWKTDLPCALCEDITAKSLLWG